jgi:hypothetical protein
MGTTYGVFEVVDMVVLGLVSPHQIQVSAVLT